jgi:hypothetical protein
MKVARLVACAALGLAACAQVPQADAVKAEENIPEGAATLPAGGKAIATFESLGLYWTPPANPGAAGCLVRYRSAGDKAWKDGLAMWYDARNGECRGSLVQLAPGTSYEVRFRMPGQTSGAQLTARTWSERFPIARTVSVADRAATLNITEGGSAAGYVLYTGGTIDAADAQPFNITIAASYVIVRGFTLKGARQDAIRIQPEAHDVVIEDNDISGWGRYERTAASGWKIGKNMDSGIAAYCRARPTLERVVIQRNRIHHPRYGANSWSEGHPSGPNGIMFSQCGGNHVFRFNEFYSAEQHYFMDAIGGEENFSDIGFPNSDTDINGNIIKHAWDDAIEAEGANRNVRIWANYIDQTTTGVATTVTHVGPVYIFRNVYNRSRQLADKPTDLDDRNVFAKSGTVGKWGGGRRYVFHNTLLQAPPATGARYPLGAGGGVRGSGANEPVTNTVSRNNIFQIWKPHWEVLDPRGAGNDFDYDLYNGKVGAPEAHGIAGTPQYQPANGWASESDGRYQLAPGSPGYDAGVRIPNFNDGYLGRAPDIGAHEAGRPPMQFGLKAARGSAAATTAQAR